MTYLPVTPFRRRTDAALMKAVAVAPARAGAVVHKWDVLRELCAARAHFGLKDRDISVLRALLSFYPKTELSGPDLIVYPSNARLAERLDGMALSTLRRHIAKLVDTGLLLRRDSPNGKRYLRKRAGSTLAFGFDLSPLVSHAALITERAQQARDDAIERQSLREDISLMRRDLLALATYGAAHHPEAADWAAVLDGVAGCAKQLRRRLNAAELREILAQISQVLAVVNAALSLPKPREMAVSDSQNERHHQNSEKEYFESEAARQTAHQPATGPALDDSVPLPLVLEACKEMQVYRSTPITSWAEFLHTIEVLRPMLGVAHDVWLQAKQHIGPKGAAITLAAMLERLSEIRSPSAYLRHLSQKARLGGLSLWPILNALTSRKSSQL